MLRTAFSLSLILLCSVGCTHAPSEESVSADELIDTNLASLRENVATAGDRLVFFQSGLGGSVEIASRVRGVGPTTKLVGTDAEAGRIDRAEPLVTMAKRAFTIVSRSRYPSGGPFTQELIDTDGTAEGTRRAPLPASATLGQGGGLLACGDQLYVNGQRINLQTGELVRKPRGLDINSKDFCLQGQLVFGLNSYTPEHPARRLYYRFELDGTATLLREELNASGYLSASNSLADSPQFIGARFLRSGDELYASQPNEPNWKRDAWNREFRSLGVVGTASGEARLVFKNVDLSTVYPVGSTYSKSNSVSCLWVTDGTPEGTAKVDSTCSRALDIHALSVDDAVITQSGRLFVLSGTGALWSSDGTVAGTRAEAPLNTQGDFLVGLSKASDTAVAVMTYRKTARMEDGQGSHDRQVWVWHPEAASFAPLGAPIATRDPLPSRVNLVPFAGGIGFMLRDMKGTVRLYARDL